MKRTFVLSLICILIYQFTYSSRFGIKSALAEGQALSIYPPVIEMQTTPPSSPIVPIQIQNNNNEDVRLSIQLIPFKTDDKTGQIILMQDKAAEGFYPYYKDRIQFLLDGKKTSTISLQPLETKELQLNVNLEKGDPPGDFYYSVVFISDPQNLTDTNTSKIPAGIGTNLLLSIGPKDKSQGGITEFSTSSFKVSGPVNFKLKLHNASKHVVSPTGIIDIYNLFGKKVGSVDILPEYVLANSDRYLSDNKTIPPQSQIIWPEKFLFGWYTVKSNIQLDENSTPLSASTYFIAFPLYVFFGLVIFLFVTLSIYLKVRKKI